MRNFILFFGILTGFIISSCTKVININLNATNPQLVIDALVSDRSVPDTVKLSETVNYFAESIYPNVSGARVIITDIDSAANFDTLKELKPTKPGNYITSKLKGVPGHTYTLSVYSNYVNAAGQTYTATSTMPAPINIDSLGQVTSSSANRFRPGGGGGNPADTSYRITVHWRDPAGVPNYYRMVLYYDDTFSNNGTYTIYSDKYSDGQEIDFTGLGHKFHAGDTALVELWCIDAPTYNYYAELNSIVSGYNGANSASPTNPLSNVSAGAVGYFTAYSVTKKSYIMK